MTPSVVIGKKQYVFAQELSVGAIAERTSRKRAEKIVGVVFLSCAALFLILSLVLGFISSPTFFLQATFWLEPNTTALLFFLSLFFGLLTVFHLSEMKTIKQTIPQRMIGDILPLITPLESDLEQVDISLLFDVQMQSATDAGFSLAKEYGHAQVEPLHFFVASLSDENAGAVLGRLEIVFSKIKDPLGRRLSSRQLGDEVMLSDQAEECLLQAFINAYTQGRHIVSVFELFYEAFMHDVFIQELFFDLGVSVEQFTNMVEWVRIHEKSREQYEQFRKAALRKPTGAMNRSMTSVATPTLDAFSEDLTAAAVQGQLEILVDGEAQIEQLFQIIEGGRQSAVLVGSEGVGKSAIIEGIAQLMVEERVPAILKDKRLVRLSLASLLSGVESAEAEDRLIQVLYEAARSGNIILALTDLEQVTDQAASVLVEFLSRGSTFAIATTTPQGYASGVERTMLGRVFQKVTVAEPEQSQAIRVLESKILGIEYTQNVSFTYMAVEKIVQLTDRFMHESYLPQKAIEVAKEVAAMVAKEKGKDGLVTQDDVGKLIAQKTGVPATRVEEAEKETLLHLEERIHARVVGQDEAVKAVASALRRARTQLRAENRPIATFLFLGPTGVGKTELAKTVAETYFGNETNMIRLDMSEYQQQDSVARLIGQPGSDKGGLLTEAVRLQPFSLVLLDELEKAHPDILNIFLQVFDDGRLTDSLGRTIDFTNAIIIATSNAGTQYIQDAIAKKVSLDQIKTTLLEEELKSVYRPELLNRFDGVIVFAPLQKKQILEITRRLIAKVAERLEVKGIHFRADDDMIQDLSNRGYDPAYGARPLRRLVQEEVDNAIAKALLEGEVKRRDTIILEKNGIRIEQATAL